MHFEVYTKNTQRADNRNSVTPPKQYPCFELVYNDDWNDYGYFTWFALWYLKDQKNATLIGELKILHKSALVTYDEIPKHFDTSLPEEFCSLGISTDYYEALKSNLNTEDIRRLLENLRDVTTNIQIQEQFSQILGFKTSLLRDLSSEKALREAKLIIEGRNKNTAYSINYNCHMPYNGDVNLNMECTVKYRPKTFERIFGIIGENGVGKTSLMKNFVNDFISNENGGFASKPLFNSLNVISSVSYDQYQPSIEARAVPYYHYNLDQSPEKIREIIEAIERISQSPALIEENTKASVYKDFIDAFFSDIKSQLLKTTKRDSDSSFVCPEWEDIEIKFDEMTRVLERMSSGQFHIFSLATFLIADLHFASLVIIDEPEVHLHPSSMMQFMMFLYSILNRFKSYAIIVTHSPLIVRELLSENVYQLKRVEMVIPQLSKVNHDTFGEDISTLYRRIFNYDETVSIFSRVVSNMISEHKNMDNIIKNMSSILPMNLNARLRIFDIINNLQHNA